MSQNLPHPGEPALRLAAECQVTLRADGLATVTRAGHTVELDAAGSQVVALLDGTRDLAGLLQGTAGRLPPLAVVRSLVRLERAGLLTTIRSPWSMEVPGTRWLSRWFRLVTPAWWRRIGVVTTAVALLWSLAWLAEPGLLPRASGLDGGEVFAVLAGVVGGLFLWRALWQGLGAQAGLAEGAATLQVRTGAVEAHAAMTAPERARAAATAWAGLSAVATAHLVTVAAALSVPVAAARWAAWLTGLALVLDAMPQGPTDGRALLDLTTALPKLGNQARAWLVRRALRNAWARRPMSAAERRYTWAATLGAIHLLLAWLLTTQRFLPWAIAFAAGGVSQDPALAPGLRLVASGLPLMLTVLWLATLALGMAWILRDAVWELRPARQASGEKKPATPYAALVVESAQKVPFLRALGPASLARLPERMEAQTWPAGAGILRQGEPGDRMCCVAEGHAVVEWEDEAGVRHPLARLNPGDFFGETAVLEDSPRTAHVVADGPATVLSLPREAARSWLEEAGAGAAELRRQLRHTAALRSHPLFAGTDAADLAAVTVQTEPVSQPAGSVILTEGEPGEDVYILLSGQCSVWRDNRQVGALQAGDWFGELAMLTGAPRNATVRAESAVDLLRLPVAATQVALARDPGAARRLWQVATERLALNGEVP